jgi:hypothetical protein
MKALGPIALGTLLLLVWSGCGFDYQVGTQLQALPTSDGGGPDAGPSDAGPGDSGYLPDAGYSPDAGSPPDGGSVLDGG